MTEIRRHSLLFIASLSIVLAVTLFVLPGFKKRGHRSYTSYLPNTASAQAAEVNPWTLAVAKIKEDRGEPTGKQAKVDIPHQVRHYSDSRRFLAIQVAEVKEHALRTPQDLVELGAMIARGEMVSLEPVSENYLLFGVGGNADKDLFTRFENGKSINLYNEEGLRKEEARLAASTAALGKEIASLKQELAGLTKRERSRRGKLQSQVAANEKTLKAVRENKELLDRHYGAPERRTQLFSEYESLARLAKSLPGRDFNIEDPVGRRDLKVRLLSSMRPEAFSVLNEVARVYREKFDRPLPITSLVRPDEYQLELSKTNPNATRIETPPHSTGLAFDIYYRYMSAAEQAHVMSHLAKLKDEGRIEVLRENRDHYHVFAFVDGARPGETLIAASMGGSAAPKAKQSHHAEPATKSNKKATKAKASSRVKAKGKRARR